MRCKLSGGLPEIAEQIKNYDGLLEDPVMNEIIDADTLQAAQRMKEMNAELEGSIFADAKPFDPEKFVTDVIGS